MMIGNLAAVDHPRSVDVSICLSCRPWCVVWYDASWAGAAPGGEKKCVVVEEKPASKKSSY